MLTVNVFWLKRKLAGPFHLTLSVCPREQRKGKDRAATLCLDLTSEYLQGYEHRSWGLFWEITPVVVGLCCVSRPADDDG